MRIFPPVCVIGGVHIDVTGRSFDKPRPAVSNPGRVARIPGGAGVNTAGTLARLGVEVAVAGPVGSDAEGEMLRAALEARNIGDGLAELPDHATGTYTAIVGPDGDLFVGLADLAIQEAVDAEWLLANCALALAPARCWLLTANLSQQTIAGLCERADGRFLAAAATSPAKAPRLRPVLPRIALLFCNLREARALAGNEVAAGEELARMLRAAGAASGLISNGERELVGWDDSGLFAIRPPPVAAIADVHGAGDALTAGTLASLIRGMALADAARIGIAAAQLTLAVNEPWRADLTFEMAAARAEAIAPARPIE